MRRSILATAKRELHFLDANIVMYAIRREHSHTPSCIAVLGLRRIISTDKHFDAIKGIVRVDPAKLARRRA